MDDDEWTESDVTYAPDSGEIDATETADQEEGLPAAWTGKYVSVSDADYWETIIDLYLEHQGISTESTKGADGTTTVGKALGGIFAEEGNVFVLVAPMAWSHVVDFAAMDTALSAKLIEEGFSNPANIMDKLHDAMAVYEKIFYCSFLEIAQGDATKDEKVVNPNDTNGPLIDGKEDPNSYYALAMNILPDLTTGEEQNRLFTRYRIQIYHDDLSVPGMTNNRDQLQLFPAYDLTHTWPAVEGNQQGEVQHYICDTAAEARDGKEFLGSNASPWTFGRE
jgi:hypothetical protein